MINTYKVKKEEYTKVAKEYSSNWDSWVRTSASEVQSLLPFRLAISQSMDLVGLEPTTGRL